MTETHAGVLTPPRRNNFFDGKLMDSRHWELEQEYGVQSRRLLSRLGLGAGILCGLEVRLAEDGSVCVAPGVAVDDWGREIVVTETLRIERVNQPTDECAHAVGDPVVDGVVTVWLCYRECGSEFQRLSHCDYGHRARCVPGLLDERFALRIGAGPPAELPGLTPEQCRAIFGPAEEDEGGEGEDEDGGEAPPPSRRAVIAALLAGACESSEEPCVPLATVALHDGIAQQVDDVYRTLLYSNEELFDLLMCLTARVEARCDHRPVGAPPRVVDLWPRPYGEIDADALKAFVSSRRLEVVLDRDMRELGLDRPDPWLGLWQVDAKGARRLALTRTGGAFEHVSPSGTQEGVAYDVELDTRRLNEDTIFVVMALGEPGAGDIVDEAEALVLDADLVATGLTAEERAKLWTLSPGGSRASLAIHDHVRIPTPASLPSGDGVAGGELHGAFGIRPIDTPPQLLAVWPPGGSVLASYDPDTTEWYRRLWARGELEVTISRALTDKSLSDSRAWLRVYVPSRDGDDIYGINEIEAPISEIVANPALAAPDGSVTYGLKVDLEQILARGEVLVVIRPAAASGSSEPLSADPPQLLLDADFRGTALSSQAVLAVWDDAWHDGPLAGLGARSTLGEQLYDHAPGGLVHYAFGFRRD
jgi:hypothetical protein